MTTGKTSGTNVAGGGLFQGFILLFMGSLLVWFGIYENQQRWLLKHRGQSTLGTLDKVTRTKNTVNFVHTSDTYSFDISFHDPNGVLQHLHCTVDDAILKKHTVDNSSFTPHPIEVRFLDDDPGVSGLPEMLGISISPFVVGGLMLVFPAISIGNRIRRLGAG